MSNIKRLRVSAVRVANMRGHVLKMFEEFELHGGKAANSSCVHCGAHVQVIEKPAPNEIDIAGSAIATNCTKQENS